MCTAEQREDRAPARLPRPLPRHPEAKREGGTDNRMAARRAAEGGPCEDLGEHRL